MGDKMNRHLHSPTKLTEFSRDFDEEPETIFSKFVSKFTTAYNNNYNNVTMIAPTTSTTTITQSIQQQQQQNDLNLTSSSSSSHENSLGDDGESQQQPSSSSGSLSNSTEILKNVEQQQPSGSSKNSLENIGFNRTPLSTINESSSSSSGDRSPRSVMHRISNLVAMRSNNHNSYKDTELHKFWMPDSKSKECYDCSQKFTTFRRKHHCRLCGQIFCAKCCNQAVPGKIIKCSADHLKVCTYCSKIVLSYLKSSDINSDLKSDLQALKEDLSTKLSIGPNINNQPDNKNLVGGNEQKQLGFGYQEERLASISNIGLSIIDRKNILQQSNSLKLLHDDMLKYLPNQNRGIDLIQFLITNQKSSNKIQAIAILNAMIDAGFLIALIQSPSDTIYCDFDENALYKLLRKDNRVPMSNSFQLDLNFESNSVQLSRPDFSNSTKDLTMLTDDDDTQQASKESQLHNTLMSTAGSKPLMEVFCEHEELLLGQLLSSENLDKSWSKILITLCARVANTMRPELCSTELMDIRNFVNFKKVPGGSRNESAITGGVVFTKNVVHKEMATKIEKPKVLLLQCAIVYQRVEGKFISIDTLLLQEKEYLRNVTARILSLNPNVVLVHKNVSGIAQDMLRKNGITLVLDVKQSVLKRLSRCLQCDIVTSIDSNIGRPKLGVCDLFYIKSYNDGNGMSKALMFFDIPSSPRGCCVLLRGGTTTELARVKKVASFLLFARYNWRLELSFLLDEFARPPSPKPNIFDSKEQSPCEISNDDFIKIHTSNMNQNQNPNTLSTVELSKKIKIEKKLEEKIVNKENVQDFSDPLRSNNILNNNNNNNLNINNDNNNLIIEKINNEIIPVEFAVQITNDNRFRTTLNSTVLSISPFVLFPLPFLETENGKKCILRSHFPNELYYSKYWSDKIDKPITQDINLEKHNIKLLPEHEFISHKITTSIDNKDLQTLYTNFRSSGGRLPKLGRMSPINKTNQTIPVKQAGPIEEFVYKDALDLHNHQRLPVLFCSYYYSPKSESSFCAQPSLLNMYFYGQNDIMLGSFLERYCFRNSYICPSCNLPMLDHVRRYVHSNGCILVGLSEDSKKNNTSDIQVTSCCTICRKTEQSVPMSQDTWCLSFAKYLELRFHGHAYKKRNINFNNRQSSNQRKEETEEDCCKHSLHKDYIQYFSYNGIVVSFEYTPIETWEIGLPPMLIQLKEPQKIIKSQAIDEVKKLAPKGYDIYVKIYDRLAELSSDIEMPILTTLKTILNQDQMIFKRRLEIVQTLLTELYINPYQLNDSMFLLKRCLVESIELWGTRLHEAAVQLQTSKKVEVISLPTIDSGTICTEELRLDRDSITEYPEQILKSNEIEGNHKKNDSITSIENCENISSETVSSANATISSDGNQTSKSNKNDDVSGKQQNSTDGSGGGGIIHTEKLKEFHDKKGIRNLLTQILPSTVNQNLFQSPLPTNEYYNLPVGIFPTLVIDQDLSSIIAYSLVSHEYKKAVDNMNSGYVSDPNNSPHLKRKSQDGLDNDNEKETINKTEYEKKTKAGSHVQVQFADITTQFTCKIYFAKEFDLMRGHFLKPPTTSHQTDKDSKKSNNNGQRNSTQPDLDVKLRNKEYVSLEHEIQTSIERKSSNNSLTTIIGKSSTASDYTFQELDEVRKSFARSLSKSLKWEARGGKSGSKFSKTLDDQFVLKEMSLKDVTIFENFAPNYFEYVHQCLQLNQPTLLAKILGVFKVTIKKKDSVHEKSVLVMENLFCDRVITNKFDLKGSDRNRLVDPSDQSGDGEIVLLDENLIQMSWSKPLYILGHSRTILRQAINRDASFLEKNDVMDYSLLVGLDKTENLLVLGIIDYIRTFTLDKRLESIVKQSGLLGGQGKLPTVISPKLYKQRFSEAMDRYFLIVPDRWDGLSKK